MEKKIKPILILQLRPEDVTSDDEFSALLRHGGLDQGQVRRLRIENTGIPEIDLDTYAAVIVGGSPFDITTPQQQKSAQQLRIEADFNRLFDQIIPRDFPFLGVCSGNGLLGNYLRTPLSRQFAEPVSAATITVTEDGAIDPLLVGLPRQFRVLLGHKEACDEVPKQATLLASGDRCAVQMFRIGKNVYATQFHPEGDPAGFAVRINTYKDHGYFPADQAKSLIDALEPEHTPHAHTILRRFVALHGGPNDN